MYGISVSFKDINRFVNALLILKAYNSISYNNAKQYTNKFQLALKLKFNSA